MTASTFHEDWFPELSCKVLGDLGAKAPAGEIIEIGSWEGRSTCALANAVHPRIVHAVDTWNGSPGEISADIAAGRDVFAQFQANVAADTAGNVEAHRIGWRDFVAPGPIALLFIDAEHTYDEVAGSIAKFRRGVVPGGVICGDDIHHPPVFEAVVDAFGISNVYVHATLWIWTK